MALTVVLTGVLAACEAPPPSPRPAAAAQRVVSEHSAVLERLGLTVRSTPKGAQIVAMDVDGPAAQGGLHVGDLLLAVNGAAAANAAELEKLVDRAPAGALRLDLVHDGQPLKVSLAAAPPSAAWNPLGLQVRELPAGTLKAMGLAYGLMVAKVRAPADRSRILPGDVIVGVDQESIRSLEQFNKLLAQHGDGTVGLLVRRMDSDLYIAIRPGGDASRGSGGPRLEETFKTRATGKPLRT